MKKLLTIAIGFGLAALEPVLGQQIQVDTVTVNSLKYDTQPTPQFEAGNVKSKDVPNPKDWLEVEVEFEARASERNAVIPELLFRYYVAVKAQDGSTKVLTGDVTHVNMVGGERYYSAVYVSPITLGKVTGDYRRFQLGAIAAVAVEVFYNGVSKGGKSEGGPAGRWWEQTQTEPGVLAKDKTPFALLWTDRYADFKATN